MSKRTPPHQPSEPYAHGGWPSWVIGGDRKGGTMSLPPSSGCKLLGTTPDLNFRALLLREDKCAELDVALAGGVEVGRTG
jgi:hypothetical protein